MTNLPYLHVLLPTAIFCGVLLFTIFLSTIDYVRNKKIKSYSPSVSFIIPTYNDASTISNTVRSVFGCCKGMDFEVFVVNDCSSDCSLQVIDGLKKKFPFKVVNNKTNLGKAKSVNNVFALTRGEIVFVLDSDTILNAKSFLGIISRLANGGVGAVSCRYSVDGKGFIAEMSALEYSMMALTQSVYNFDSCITMWGGCVAFRRNAFKDVGLFKENMLNEDMDCALSLTNAGWKVKQHWTPVETSVPHTILGWYKQKIRWAAGVAQCFLKYPTVFLKNPFIIFYFVTTVATIVLFIYSVLDAHTTSFPFTFGMGAVYSILSLPYAIVNITKFKHAWKMLMVFPYSLIYFPVFVLVSFIGFVIGAKKYFELKEGGRGW